MQSFFNNLRKLFAYKDLRELGPPHPQMGGIILLPLWRVVAKPSLYCPLLAKALELLVGS